MSVPYELTSKYTRKCVREIIDIVYGPDVSIQKLKLSLQERNRAYGGEFLRILNSHLRGEACIHAAVVSLNAAACQLFIDYGADVDLKNEADMTPLALACTLGSVDIAKLLIQHGAHVNVPSGSGETVLHIACKNSHLELCRLLLQSDADVDFTDGSGFSALHHAIQAHNNDIVIELARHNCDTNQATRVSRSTALMLACCSGHKMSSDIIQNLILAGCDLNLVDLEHNTALMIAVIENHPSSVRLLLQNGANPSIPNSKRVTPLLYAVQQQYTDIISMILTSRAGLETLNLADHEGNTPLSASICFACKFMKLANGTVAGSIADKLLDLGCDMNISMKPMDWTPLFVTVAMGNEYYTKKLLERGADAKLTDKSDDSLLHVAACRSNDVKVSIIRLLMEYGCPIDSKNGSRETPLYKSVNRRAPIEVIELLLKQGVQLNVQSRPLGMTPLHAALGRPDKYHEAAALLIQYGCDINCTDIAETSCLSKCIASGDTKGTEMLLAVSSIDVNRGGMALPLHTAVYMGNENLIGKLLQHGADINKTRNDGLRPIQIAIQNNQRRIIRSLLNHGCTLDPTETAADLMFRKKCCYEHTDAHPHAELQPLFAALKFDDMEMFKSLLDHYYRKPYQELHTIHDMLTIAQDTGNRMQQLISSSLRTPTLELLRDELANPWSLLRLARGAALQAVGVNRREKINALEIPKKLKHYLLFEMDQYLDMSDLNIE